MGGSERNFWHLGKSTENLESDNCNVDNNYFKLWGLKSPATIGSKNQVEGEKSHKSLLQEPPTQKVLCSGKATEIPT